MKTKKYKPLPNNLTIQKSDIDGLGIFATKDIKKNINLGVMHHITEFNNVIRTPLGGFINHNNTPNCKTFYEGRLISIITLTDIKAGEEITLKYTMYDPSR